MKTLVIPAVLVAITGLCTYGAVRAIRPGVARIEFPSEVNLGFLELLVSYDTSIPIANKGNAPLVISDIRLSCSCLLLRWDDKPGDALYDTPKEITIAPGETYNLRPSFTPRGSAYGPAAHTIDFRTNDPDQPTARVVLRFNRRGGLIPAPPELNFGAHAVGSTTSKGVEIHDTDQTNVFAISRAEVSRPETFQVEWSIKDELCGRTWLPRMSG
jgi:Protein of unknown function (DUF1573)